MQVIDRIPLPILIVAAVLFALAPFYPEPHLWEKLGMLVHGDLAQPEDIFDLIIHGGPLLLVAWKVRRDFRADPRDAPEDSVDGLS